MLGKLIGNTPLIAITYRYKQKVRTIYTKLEFYNLTGSIKDRVAYYMIDQAKKKGLLKDGMPLVEATSGNTGIALAALGAYAQHPVVIFMPDWVSEERAKILKMYGAQVFLFSKQDGGFATCLKEAEQYAEKHHGFLTNQFANLDNVAAHYETTGPEILDKIIPDGFISGIGTGGTLMGIAESLKEKNAKCQIWALEPETMSLLKTGTIGSHKIDGIGDEFIPAIVDPTKIDEIVLINDQDAIAMAHLLATKLGLGVGISSGANMLGAILLEEQIGGNIATVFPDDLKKYISSDLGSQNMVLGRLSSQIELLSYQIVGNEK